MQLQRTMKQVQILQIPKIKSGEFNQSLKRNSVLNVWHIVSYSYFQPKIALLRLCFIL